MTWLLKNKEWLFSGALIAIPLSLIGWWLARKSGSGSQNQRSGKNSVNLQSRGQINIGGDVKNERSKSK